MAKETRFETIYKQTSAMTFVCILRDTKTGVNYLFSKNGYAGGLTPLLDENGEVVVTDDI